MTGKTHITIATTISIPLIAYFKLPLYVIAPVIIGSVFPDIDIKNSTISKIFPFNIISFFIRKIDKHRTFTHSLYGISFFYFSLYFILTSCNISASLINFFLIGMVSHILSDMLTYKGVAIFYPYKKFYGLKLIKTNSIEENFILILCFIGIFIFFLK
ncbi:MAG: metal-dependent hydrolase [archaeon]